MAFRNRIPDENSDTRIVQEVTKMAAVWGGSDQLMDDISIDERALLDHVDESTDPEVLANQLLELHRSGKLSRPLIGLLRSNLHVFKLDPAKIRIMESFSATVLPVPELLGVRQDTFQLTMQDIFGDSTIPASVDRDARIAFSIGRLRVMIGKQIPKMERLRAIARALEMKKTKGFGEKKETFAAQKRMSTVIEM